MFRPTLLLAFIFSAPSVALCAGRVNESAFAGIYASPDGSTGCSLRITGQTEERFGQREVFDIGFTLSNSDADRVQFALKTTGSLASRFGMAADDDYERVEGGRIEANGTEMAVSSFRGATRGPNGMIESTIDRATVRPLLAAILRKLPITIGVKPTWQRSERVFAGIVDLPAEDTLRLAQCVKARAASDSER